MPKKKYPKNIERFINHVKHQCDLLDVEFKLTKGYAVYTGEGNSCFGFFSPPNEKHKGLLPNENHKGLLKVAIGKKTREEWILTLAHEYAHMLQWFNQDKIYEDFHDNEDVYFDLEIQTEKEALKILTGFDIKITDSLKRKSDKYIRQIRELLIESKKK